MVVLALSLWHFGAVSSGANRPSPPSGEITRTPVLVELFTSEGCSSCPPADRLLEKLDRSQPVREADLIVLSEHVDYWNSLGWKDPYSSHEYSERQSGYAQHFGLNSVYTPQMVVDGDAEFSGGDERRAIQTIESASKAEKIPVVLSSIRLEDKHMLTLHLEAGPLTAAASIRPARILVALADNSDESSVSRGENAGRMLRHVAVLRTLTQVGSIDKRDKFSKDLTFKLNQENPEKLRILAIVQEPTPGKVWGVASFQLSN